MIFKKNSDDDRIFEESNHLQSLIFSIVKLSHIITVFPSTFSDKTKKKKNSAGSNLELELSRDYDNSLGSYSGYGDGAEQVSISDLYQPYNTDGVVVGGSIKKRRRTSAPTVVVKTLVESEDENSMQEESNETQAAVESIEEMTLNGSEIVADLTYENVVESQQEQTDDQDKLNSMSAFQLSTHFVPINGKVTEYEDEFANENSMGEAPLNLATDSH